MSATVVSSSWPPVAGGSGTWRFAQEVEVGGRRALQWVQRRNCSISPRQLGAVYGSFCIVALAISAGFWLQGAPLVSAFAFIELLVLAVAFVVHARHVADREVLTLAGQQLAVEQHQGTRVARADFPAQWLAVEPVAGQGSLIQLSAHGRSVRVGRFLRPEMRAPFAQELRRALRRTEGPRSHPTRCELE